MEEESYYKLTNLDEVHHNVKYDDGLITDPIAFNESSADMCVPGGIYFCKESEIGKWICYSNKIGPMRWMRKVIIPSEAKVLHGTFKSKANQVILGPREEIPQSFYNQFCLESNNANYIKDVIFFCYNILQTDIDTDVLLQLMISSGFYLEFIPNCKNMKLLRAAVTSYGHALRYINPNDVTPTNYQELCFIAVKESGCALQHVRKFAGPTYKYYYELCCVAIKNYCAITWVRKDWLAQKEYDSLIQLITTRVWE